MPAPTSRAAYLADRCRDCLRFLVAGACPIGCEKHRKPSMRAKGEDRAQRLETRRTVARENRIAIVSARLHAPSPFAANTVRGLGGEHENRIDTPLAICPRCGSTSYRSHRGRYPAECADCGSVAFEGVS